MDISRLNISQLGYSFLKAKQENKNSLPYYVEKLIEEELKLRESEMEKYLTTGISNLSDQDLTSLSSDRYSVEFENQIKNEISNRNLNDNKLTRNLADNVFFTFIKPYLSYIDKGHLYRKPFSWLYTFFALINLIIPIYIFFNATSNHIFENTVRIIITFIFIWIFIVFASWVGFQLWWDRKSKITKTSAEGDEFVATPVLSHFIQTLGEWMGTWIAIVGFSSALLTTTILGEDAAYFAFQAGIPFIKSGFIFIILMPFLGFFIIITARFTAEQFRALSSIANNTKKK